MTPEICFSRIGAIQVSLFSKYIRVTKELNRAAKRVCQPDSDCSTEHRSELWDLDLLGWSISNIGELEDRNSEENRRCFGDMSACWKLWKVGICNDVTANATHVNGANLMSKRGSGVAKRRSSVAVF